MQLTKHVHSCVRIDDGDRSLVFDPGAFSDLDAALDGVGAVLITHEHFDHVEVDKITAALERDPRLQLFAPASVAASFERLGEQVRAVGPGEAFDAAGFAVRSFGGLHAVMHPLLPVVSNVAFLVDDLVFHPGDSFTVPPAQVDTLLLPAMAPWSKLSEVIDYTIAVRAPHALPIHDGLVTDVYPMVLRGNLVPLVEPFGVELGTFDGTVDVASRTAA